MMPWNSDPMVRDLAGFCSLHGFPLGVFVGLSHTGERVQVVTYGRTARLCNVAKGMGDQTLELIQAGKIAPSRKEQQ